MDNEVNLTNPTSNTEISLFDSKSTSTVPNGFLREFLIDTHSTTLGLPLDVVTNEVDSGFVTSLDEESRGINSVRVVTDIKDRVTNTLITGGDAEGLALDSGRELDAVTNSEVPSMDAVIMSNDPNSAFAKIDRVTVHRRETIRKKLLEKFDASPSGVVPSIGQFLDVLISVPKEVLEGGAFARSSAAEQLRGIITNPILSEKEFQAKADEIINNIADTGIFTNNNMFYVQQLMDSFESKGSRRLDEIFFFADLFPVATGSVKVLNRLRRSADIAAATLPRGTAENLIRENLVKETGDVSNVLDATSPSITSLTNDGGPSFFNAAGAAVLRAAENLNKTLKIINRPDWGSYIQPDVFDRVKPQILEELNKYFDFTSPKRRIDFGILKAPLGNLVGFARYGTSKGGFFKNRRFAETFADSFEEKNGISASVVETLQEGQKQFYVRVERNIETGDFFNPLNADEITTNFFSKIGLGSTFLTTSKYLDRILKRSEGQLGVVIREVMKPYKKLRLATPPQDREFIDEVYHNLRDGTDSIRRKPFETEEFIQLYYNKFGVKPSQKIINYQTVVQETMDTLYYLRADPLFKEAVNDGQEALLTAGGIELRVKKLEGAPNGSVYNIEEGRLATPEEISQGGIDIVQGGYKVQKTDEISYMYVIAKDSIRRRLYHSDVLNYNPGGVREYLDIKRFIKQSKTMKIHGLDGKVIEVEGIPVTFLGTVTEAEGRLAKSEINNLFTGIRKFISNSDEVVDLALLKPIDVLNRISQEANNPVFAEFVANNVKWNLNISSVEDLVKFLDEFNLDIRKSVEDIADGDPLIKETVGGDFNFSRGTTPGETVASRVIKTGNTRHRLDKPLRGYGGETADTFSPIEATERSFSKAVSFLSEFAYLNNSTKAWWAGAQPFLTNRIKDNLDNLNIVDRLRLSVLNDSKEGRAFAQERDVILRRIGSEDDFTKLWKRTMDDFGDFIYDKGAKGASKKFRNVFSPDPTIALRSMAFDFKLGFFAPHQLFVQANQAVNVIAIGGPDGFRGALTMLPLRAALLNGNEAVIKEIGRRSRAFTGLTPEQFADMVEYTKRSGRDQIGAAIAEHGNADTLAAGYLLKVRELGRFFFNEGEGLGRLAAIGTAYREFLRKFPGQSILDDRAGLWMADRTDVLTAGMTRASSSASQRFSLTSVPFQFLSYTQRMMEQLFSNRILTGAERRRLALAQFIFWGASGYGAGSFLDEVLKASDIQLSNEQYTFLKFGIVDGIINVTTGLKTTLGERLSFAEGGFDLFTKISDGKFLEVIGGPSIAVGSDITSSLLTVLGDAVHGRYNMLENDVIGAFRNLSSANNLVNAWFMWKYGEYVSRRGRTIATGLNEKDGIFHILTGNLPQDVLQTYDFANDQRLRRKALNEMGVVIRGVTASIVRAYRDGNDERALNLGKELATYMSVADPFEYEFLRKFMEPEWDSLQNEVLRRAQRTLDSQVVVNATINRPRGN